MLKGFIDSKVKSLGREDQLEINALHILFPLILIFFYIYLKIFLLILSFKTISLKDK